MEATNAICGGSQRLLCRHVQPRPGVRQLVFVNLKLRHALSVYAVKLASQSEQLLITSATYFFYYLRNRDVYVAVYPQIPGEQLVQLGWKRGQCGVKLTHRYAPSS
jgi:hypothetical protein